MKAEIIAVGSELHTPDRLDTNSLFLTEALNKLGIEVLRKTIVGDTPEALRDAFAGALKRVEVVVSCGGLGPTADDLTRQRGRGRSARGGGPPPAIWRAKRWRTFWAGDFNETIASCTPSKPVFAASGATCRKSMLARPWCQRAPKCWITREAPRQDCGWNKVTV